MKKTDYKFMHVILNQCLRLNNGKAMFAVFLYSVIQFFVMGLVVIPVKSLNSVLSLLVSLILLIVANTLSEVLLYGLYVIMSRLVEKKHVTIGYLFIGFRRNQKKIFKAGLVFTLIYVLITVFFSIVFFIFRNSFADIVEKIGFAQLLPLIVIVVFFISVLVTIPFLFSRIIIYNDNELSVLDSFKRSAFLMKGHFFNFIGFLLYAGGFNLLEAIVIQLFLFILPQSEDMSYYMQLVTTFLSIAGIMAQYKALTRFFIAIPVYYYSLTGIIHPHIEEDSLINVEDNQE